MTKQQAPRLLHSELTGRIYVATRYRTRPDGVIVVAEKFDVTDDFMAIAAKLPEDPK